MIWSALVSPSTHSLTSIENPPTNPPSKTLHSVFTPPKPLHLHTNEILCPPKSPELLPTSHPCYRNPWQILQACKASDYHQNLCRLNQCFHDDSFDCELWTRLHEWMPKGTRYCRECRRFTKRDKRRRKGACKLHHTRCS